MQTLLQPDELVALNDGFEEAHPREILTWALERSGLERIAIASAFQAEGTIVMHMATQMRPDIPILFLETGYQFAETLAFKEQLAERLGLNVVDLVGEYTVERQAEVMGPRLFERDPGEVLRPEQGAADVRGAPRAGRVDHRVPAGSSPTRATAPFVQQYELEPDRWIVKVNPMAAWSLHEVWAYLKEHDLPHNPLYDLGYSSIGCAPCTRMRLPDEPERAGRWAGLSKWECGIQVTPGAISRIRPVRPRPRGPRARAEPPGGDGRRASRRRPAPGTAPSR